MLEKLQEAGRLDLGDHMTFEIAVDDEHPEIEAEGMKYGGLRFRAKCELAGKIYGSEFGVDVAFAGPMLGDPETIVAEDVLEFAGISPPTLRLYPIETHIAEKLHAYTLVRKRPNSRVKDLPDLALLASIQPPEADRIRAGLKLTFDFRATHPAPTALAAPPPAWTRPYEKMVADFDLAWRNLDEVTAAARAFLDPVLAPGPVGRWDPAEWRWT